jgi:hypothetical protein
MITKRAFLDKDSIVIAIKDLNINELVEGDVPEDSYGDVRIQEDEVVEIGMKWNGETDKFE